MAGEATAGNGASGGDLRASILSELSSGPKDDAPAELAPDEETPSDEPAAESDDPDLEAAPAEDEPEPDDDEPTDPDPDEEPEPDADPKVAKGLDQVRRAEKHARAKLEAERAEIAAERAQHKQALAEVEEFKTLAKRAKYDAASVLRALGLTEDDFENAAQSIYAESKAAAADPNRKAAVQARLREREKEDKLTATEKRIAELEAKLEADKAEAAAAREAEQYLAGINASIAKTPLVKHLWNTDGESTTVGLQHAFDRLSKAGKPTTPQHVVAEYEKRERIRLEKLGVDVSKFAKPAAKVAAKPGAKPVVAADKKPANTNGAAKKVPTRDEIVAELARLQESEKLTS